MLGRKKKQPEVGRRQVGGGVVNIKATRFNYRSDRSVDESNTGRTNREEQVSLAGRPVSQWYNHIPAYFITLVIIGTIIYSLTLSTNPKVELVGQKSQTIVQPLSVYQQATENILKSSFSNRTKLTINTDAVASQIEQKYPEINAVSIIIPAFGHQPILKVRPAQSIFILVNPQGEYVINQQGNAVLMLNSVIVNKYNLPTVKDDTGFKVTLGEEALSSSSVKFIKTVVDQFVAKNMVITSMSLSTVPYELDVQVRGEPYYIKFNLMTNPLYATGTYFATIKLFNSTNPAPTQYIDVRIPGRAYYK